MGHTTFVHILNDGMDQIAKYPDEFAEVVVGNLYGGRGGVGCHANSVTVLKSQHADTFQLAASFQNLALSLSRWDKTTMEVAERRPDIVKDMIKRARFALDDLEEAIDGDG